MKTLRDEFAMAALTGLLAQKEGWSMNTIADSFYIADEMSSARGENKPSDGWIEWKGGQDPIEMPVIEVKTRNGETIRDYHNNFNWNHNSAGLDIIAYRVVEAI